MSPPVASTSSSIRNCSSEWGRFWTYALGACQQFSIGARSGDSAQLKYVSGLISFFQRATGLFFLAVGSPTAPRIAVLFQHEIVPPFNPLAHMGLQDLVDIDSMAQLSVTIGRDLIEYEFRLEIVANCRPCMFPGDVFPGGGRLDVILAISHSPPFAGYL